MKADRRSSAFTDGTIDLYAKAGQVGIGRLLDTGDLEFIPLRRVRKDRNPAKNGRYRWYNDHRLPDFASLYAGRNDAESINRHLDDTFWLRRAHSIGHARQHLNLLGFALAVNSVALHEHPRRRAEPAAA